MSLLSGAGDRRILADQAPRISGGSYGPFVGSAQGRRRQALDLHAPARGRVAEGEETGVQPIAGVAGQAGGPVPRQAPSAYSGSPTRGWPAAARWMRIWCGRPVGMAASTRASPSRTSRSRTWVVAGFPPDDTAWTFPSRGCGTGAMG